MGGSFVVCRFVNVFKSRLGHIEQVATAFLVVSVHDALTDGLGDGCGKRFVVIHNIQDVFVFFQFLDYCGLYLIYRFAVFLYQLVVKVDASSIFCLNHVASNI